MQVCIVCLTAEAVVKLYPCGHKQLCTSCTIQLRTAQCPSCRAPAETAHFPTARPCRRFQALLDARAERDNAVVDDTVQVLIAGPGDSEQFSLAFCERLREIFPLVQPQKRKRSWGWFPGSHRCRKSPPNEDRRAQCIDLNPADELEGLGFESRFAPNARVDGILVRFSWYRLPPLESHSRAVISNLLSFKPDFLLLTSSLQLRSTFAKMLSWDLRLRRIAPPAQLPQRMWIILAPPRAEPGRISSNEYLPPNMDLHEDVYEGLNSMPIDERPITYEVLGPRSWFTKSLKRVGSRSVFHATKTRVFSAETDFSFSEDGLNPTDSPAESPTQINRMGNSVMRFMRCA